MNENLQILRATKLYNRALLLSLMIIFSLALKANNIVSGKVVDENGKGLELVIVSLHNANDSMYVQSEFTDLNGNFTLSDIENGDYYIQTNLLGYQLFSKEIKVTKDIELGEFVLTQDANLLSEVTVTAKTPYIERKIDRVVVNPDALISNAGTNALEVLERAPGVLLDNDGNILLKGRSGVAIYINDKPSYLSGTELENYLRSLPSGSIKKIELITNPPAKYEAAGNGGVINIVIKRSTLKGVHGNLSTGFRHGKRSSSNNNLNLSYNKGNFGLYTNISGGFYASLSDLTINRYYQNELGQTISSFTQQSDLDRAGKYFNAKTGVDYYPSMSTTLGLSYKHISSPPKNKTINEGRITDDKDQLLQRVTADNLTEGTFEGRIYNAYIQHKLDTIGSKISFDADYVTYRTGSDQLFKNNLYNDTGAAIFADRIDGQIPATIDIIALKSDYSRPLGKGKFDAGIKTALTNTDNEAIYSNTIDGITTQDFGASNRFLYDEWINAGYINYRTSFGKVDLQAGFRAEFTRLTGDQLGNQEVEPSSFERNYQSYFPTFYMSWRVDSLSNNVLNLSYGKRIRRPYFQNLNPFISPLDKFTFYVGNPDLLPTFSHNVSLTYSWKGTFNTTASYSKVIDGINETLEIRDQIYYSRPGNIANSETWSLSMDYTKDITNWYAINAYAEGSHNAYESRLYTEQLNSSGMFYFISAGHNFILGKGWKADIYTQWQSDLTYAQLLLKGYEQVNIGLQKIILDGKGSLKLGFNDIFRTRIGAGDINNLRLTEADWINIRDTRIVSLTFSLRFGTSQSKKQKYNSSGSDSEQRRVKG